MVRFSEYVKRELGIEMPKGDIPGSWFVDNRIHMVVRCSCCDMTMASPSAWIDDEGYTYCSRCADVEEE